MYMPGRQIMSNSHPVYFGGSRHLAQEHPTHAILKAVTRSVLRSGCAAHVGCQAGADQSVIWSAIGSPLFVFVFAVAPTLAQAPAVVERAFHAGASVTLAAGGLEEIPVKARYLLRSNREIK
jgi:hypothetical protein